MADDIGTIPEDLQGRGFTPEQVKMILRLRLEVSALVAKLSETHDFFSTDDVRVVLEAALERLERLKEVQMVPLS